MLTASTSKHYPRFRRFTCAALALQTLHQLLPPGTDNDSLTLQALPGDQHRRVSGNRWRR